MQPALYGLLTALCLASVGIDAQTAWRFVDQDHPLIATASAFTLQSLQETPDAYRVEARLDTSGTRAAFCWTRTQGHCLPQP